MRYPSERRIEAKSSPDAPVNDVMPLNTVKPPPGNAPDGFDTGCAFAPRQRGTDQIGKTLKNIDTHRALAADPITGGAI